MKPFFVFASLLVGYAAADYSPLSSTPTGEYVVARLELSGGLAGAPQQLFVAFRDGRLATLWFVMPIEGDQRLNVERSSLTLTPQGLRGDVHLRTALARQQPILSVRLSLDLTSADGRLSGSYDLDMGRSKYQSSKGTAVGSLHRSAPASDTLAAQAGWATFSGSNGDMSAQPQPPLIEDLASARPVWRSEVPVPTAYGNAPDSRYFVRAAIAGNGGGGSSPIVADGTVYISFYVPNERTPPELKNPYWEQKFADAAAFRKHMVEMNANDVEARWVLHHFAPTADDHIAAIDAATGATKWRTVLPQRSPNLQTHKHRGISGVPLVAGQTIFVPNLAGCLYALDAATGKVRWEFPKFEGPTKQQGRIVGPANPSPLLIGETLFWSRGGQLYALDPATGREKWKTPGGYLLRWASEGRERLVTFAGQTLVCLDPATGRSLWSQETDLAVHAPLSAVIAGDILIASPPLNKTEGAFRFRGLQLNETGASELWQAAPLVPDENVPITIAAGRAYFLGRQSIHAVEVATGKSVAARNFTEHGPGSNAWLGVVGERLLLLPEGQHGTARLGFLDRQLNSIGGMWQPTNTDTTAYNSQPIVYPIVDGRLFVRGGDGVYCYDLRK